MHRQQSLAPACTLTVILACNSVGMGQLTSHVPLEEQRFHLEEHARSILEPLLFCNEQRFTSPISGMELFQATFTAKGTRDSRGR